MLRNVLILAFIMAAGFLLSLADEHLFRPSALPAATQTPLATKAESAPDFSFTDNAGISRKLSDYKGRIVILNFWASWCAPCVKEFPLLLSAANTHEKNVTLIALSSDIDAAAMNDFLMRKNFDGMDKQNILIGHDEGGKITQGLFQTFRLPETIIIDRAGLMREKLVGANWSKEALEDIISRY